MPTPPTVHHRALAALQLLLAGPDAARAADTSFQVSARITRGCLVNQALPGAGSLGELGRLDFGQHPSGASDRLSVALARNPAITLSCTPGVALNMSVDGGQNPVGGVRQLRAGDARLAYRLYRDAGLGQEIPLGAGVGIAYDDPADIRLPIHAALQLPGRQSAGHYQDRLTVTLSW